MFPSRVIAAALVAATVPSVADDVERYKRFMEEVRDFDRYTNAEVNDVVFDGLYSDNPRVVELTIATIHGEVRNRFLRKQAGLLPGFRASLGKLDRDFARVPGLRDFLIDYVREGLAEHGWKAVVEQRQAILEGGRYDIYDRNVWNLAYLVVLDLFPGDSEVRQLVQESERDRPDARALKFHERPLLSSLNVGLYTDAEADELRSSLLWHSEPKTAELAARGLAMSATAEGLEAMKGALWRRDESLDDIVAAMASYGAPAAKHLAALRGPGGELAPSLRANRTVLRLMSQVARLAEAAEDASRRHAERPKAASSDAPEEHRFAANGLPIVAEGSRRAPLDAALANYDAFPDRQILDAAFAGLHDGGEAAAERTVEALGAYAAAIVERDWPQYSPRGNQRRLAMDVRTRPLSEVPGLRGFLASRARRDMARDGCREQAGDGERPPWMPSVAILAAYFPANAEVRDLVLEMGRCLREAGADYGVLPLLAAGRFRGAAVDREAMDELRHADPMRAGWGARRLCWTLSDEGLAGLVAALDRRDEALADIVEGVACFGDRAAPHLPALQALRRGRLSEAAFARIESATAKVGKLAGVASERTQANAPG